MEQITLEEALETIDNYLNERTHYIDGKELKGSAERDAYILAKNANKEYTGKDRFINRVSTNLPNAAKLIFGKKNVENAAKKEKNTFNRYRDLSDLKGARGDAEKSEERYKIFTKGLENINKTKDTYSDQKYNDAVNKYETGRVNAVSNIFDASIEGKEAKKNIYGEINKNPGKFKDWANKNLTPTGKKAKIAKESVQDKIDMMRLRAYESYHDGNIDYDSLNTVLEYLNLDNYN